MTDHLTALSEALGLVRVPVPPLHIKASHATATGCVDPRPTPRWEITVSLSASTHVTVFAETDEPDSLTYADVEEMYSSDDIDSSPDWDQYEYDVSSAPENQDDLDEWDELYGETHNEDGTPLDTDDDE